MLAARFRCGWMIPNLVSCAGPMAVLVLAERCGLATLVTDRVRIVAKGGANAAAKITTLIAGMAAGGDSINDMDPARLDDQTRSVTMRDTVDWEMPRRSPRNSWVPLCRRYMHAISTARYSSHDFGRPTFLFHGSPGSGWSGHHRGGDRRVGYR